MQGILPLRELGSPVGIGGDFSFEDDQSLIAQKVGGGLSDLYIAINNTLKSEKKTPPPWEYLIRRHFRLLALLSTVAIVSCFSPMESFLPISCSPPS
jgi:hypothetical protein